MKFKYEDLEESILYEDSTDDLTYIESTEWTQDHKMQSRSVIFQHNETGKFYMIEQTRSGSPFTDWHYEEQHLDKNGMLDCEEVTKHEVITYEWR